MMFKAICIKPYKQIRKGEIVKGVQLFNGNIMYFKGLKVEFNMLLEEFNTRFIPLRAYYIVEKPDIKRRFRRPKKDFLRVDFPEASEDVLINLYCHAFSYIELVRQIQPELILTFNYSIVSTLEKLEHLYKILPICKFNEAVIDAEQVFKGIYNTAISIEIEALPKEEDYNRLLEGFKMDNAILGRFFIELNKQAAIEERKNN